MKNSFSSIRDKIVKRYTQESEYLDNQKSTNINVLLNRVKLDQKKESRNKILFTAATSIGVLIFGVLIF
jgi:hypothetical protein